MSINSAFDVYIGYVPGLGTASNQYYSVGLTTTGPEPFNTYNVAVPWNSL